MIDIIVIPDAITVTNVAVTVTNVERRRTGEIIVLLVVLTRMMRSRKWTS